MDFCFDIFPLAMVRSLDDAAREVVNGRENMDRLLPGGRAGVYLFDQAFKTCPAFMQPVDASKKKGDSRKSMPFQVSF
jgi:hypothetical protein